MFGRALRHAALALLVTSGTSLTLDDIRRALSDALRYEARAGRVVRTERGRYRVGRVSSGMRYRVVSRFGAPVA